MRVILTAATHLRQTPIDSETWSTLLNRLKLFRGLATRNAKPAAYHQAGLAVAAAIIRWLR